MMPAHADSALRGRVLAAFAQAHGGAPTVLVQAPGRVNLIGEHTDYNGGFVLPCAIGHHTLVAARPRADRRVRVVAADQQGMQDDFALDGPITRHAFAAWTHYVRGMVLMLRDHGLPLPGADLAIAGDVPAGAGLSSSAALEVAIGQAFKALLGGDGRDGPQHGGPGLDATTLAQLAQRAENEFAGCHCGIMDQLISARGEAGHALLIDCRSLQCSAVPMPVGAAVMIVHSRVRRGLLDSAYNTRRAQCEQAAEHFGVPTLRDVDDAMLADAPGRLAPVLYRRARHVVTENQRTLAASGALAAGDLPAMGRLMAASHASLRDDFEVSVPAMDGLVGLLQAAIGAEGGARMTGGGFGGCAVALMPQHRVDAVREAVTAGYRAPGGEAPLVWVCQASQGASSLPL